jgi:hypothetical protein
VPDIRRPKNQGFAGAAAGRRNPTDENLMITARENVLEDAVKPAEAALDDRAPVSYAIVGTAEKPAGSGRRPDVAKYRATCC